MSSASRYQHHYANWNRMRSIQQRPFLARPESNLARTAAAMHNGNNVDSVNVKDKEKDKKTHDSLFGPNIGVVTSGPAWTAISEKKVLTDELTPDIVESWVAKSKNTSQPTTTLQALVNLKRPTIRLSPLSSEDFTSPIASDSHHHHGLEFEYDCDAPKCGIYVHVLLPKEHPDAPVTASSSGLSKHLVFESIVEGGFGKLLKLEDGALLELGRFEHIPRSDASAPTPGPTPANVDSSTATGDVSATTPADPNSTTGATAARNTRRRFTPHLHFRKRSAGQSVSGPALAVVDAAAEPSPANSTDAKGNGKDETMEGVRVTIRLAALDEQGTELASPNEQVTYLHVVRFGARAEGSGDTAEEDTRPWVVKVVKREATIGPHTFHLHEIYGLTSSSTSTHTHAPTASLPATGTPPAAEAQHTYPPTSNDNAAAAAGEDDVSSECLLCLSSPREVVLLPCRHLVACKDCALNMVEFGAGGNITQSEATVAAGSDAADAGGTGAGGDTGTGGGTDVTTTTEAAAATAAPTPTPNTRRKRKAKGWFCPVCRQPYTSLLRITTSPPPPQEESDKEAENTEADEANAAQTPQQQPENTRSGGRLARAAPSFLRSISFNRAPPPGDVESQAGAVRAGS
ncbi:putative zinc finger, C3HC4 type (RING finger) [Lyophyllum shimeji]|uniref:Zinc finger, C3HC4 type (RING finger) n=1 Tax=Lyophyllum shimeji TaxID=47721 RepID=A0A9P3UR39_LYOSH|nr:putative zinc finger, C3HC4 type (RING finger) [Lyophyllum shimeji]